MRQGLTIGVVGGGIAGLGAAWLLAPRHDVRLFERRPRLGGHTHTHRVDEEGRSLDVDSGFIVYNVATYPLLSRLLDALGVASQPTNMSFSVRCERCDLTYSGLGPGGLFADWKNATRPEFLRLLLDILRFHRFGRSVALEASNGSLGSLASSGRFGSGLGRHYLLPLASALWSTGIPDILRFPVRTLLDFFRRHRLLQIRDRLDWRTIAGGSRRYIDAMNRRLAGRTHTDASVTAVTRDGGRPRLHFADGGSQEFDRVILATHADQSLALLGDPTDDERELLGAWRYARSDTWLHRDETFLARQRAAHASWNYHLADCDAPSPHTTMTYNLNRLQRLETERSYLVTLNPARTPRSSLARMTYSHPVYTPESVATQSEIAAINGRRRTYYAGAYLGFGFHEDALRSAVEVADALGGGQW